jgi:hypothetical protein
MENLLKEQSASPSAKRIAGKIHAFWDVKEDYNLPDEDFLEFECNHVIQPCTFQLVRRANC